MESLRRLMMCGLVLATAGCSIRPLPEDVTGDNTYEIVRKIRCETRDAIRGFAIALVRKRHPDLADELQANPALFAEVNKNRSRLHPEIRQLIDRYDGAMAGYEFTFDITEKNNIGGGLDFLGTLTRRTTKLGLSASNERERQNTRNFRIYDSFENAAVILPNRYCTEPAQGPHYLYPITGSLKRAEMIGTFLNLNQSGNLTGENGVPRLADTVHFLTRFTGSAKPSIEIAPLGRAYELVGASLDATGVREDKHQVIIVLTLPPEAAPKKASGPRKRSIAEQRFTIEYEFDRQRALSEGNVRRELRDRLERLTR